ncbi:MAG: isochorismatase family protein [Deltaproteobacteria bacterium]|nr:isochorismatase family protein [Deltaproteobacteria bacterium]
MRKVRYTTAASIKEDCRAWMAAVAEYVRHPGTGDLRRAALVVLDAQRYFLDPDAPAFLPSAPAILENVRRLVSTFRKARLPIIFTRHRDPDGDEGDAMESWWGRRLDTGSAWRELDPGCGHEPGDAVVDKTCYSAFRGTDLKARLAGAGVDTVVLAGVQTHLCVETTARDSFQAGFRPALVMDATAAPDLDLHLGSLKALAQGFARVTTTAEVVASLASASAIECPPVDTHGETPLDILVIGGGPAGIAAAIQSHRMGLAVRLIERDRPGGLVNAAFRVENYPGFPGGIRGSDLAARLTAHARDAGVDLHRGDVLRVDHGEKGFDVRLSDGGTLSPRVVIAATGTVPAKLGVPGEDRPADHSIFYRVDDVKGHSHKKTATVAGGGDCALDQALHLWHRGYRVSVLIRGPRTKAIDILSDRVADTGIEVRTRTVITGIRDDKTVVLSVDGPGGPREIETDILLVSVGRGPRLTILDGVGGDALSESADTVGRTEVPGLYLAGDCRRGLIRQTAVAVGDGVAAAMDAARFLEKGTWK